MEQFTRCDFCEHLQECREKSLLIDFTLGMDTTRHFIPNELLSGCPRKDDENDRESI